MRRAVFLQNKTDFLLLKTRLVAIDQCVHRPVHHRAEQRRAVVACRTVVAVAAHAEQPSIAAETTAGQSGAAFVFDQRHVELTFRRRTIDAHHLRFNGTNHFASEPLAAFICHFQRMDGLAIRQRFQRPAIDVFIATRPRRRRLIFAMRILMLFEE